MPVDTKQIKKAFDEFEDENYVDSEETLSKEIKKAKNDYLKKELDLENDVEKVDSDEEDEGDDTNDKDKDDDEDE